MVATAFHESIELTNLTVTVYLVFQGVCQLALLHSAYSSSELVFITYVKHPWCGGLSQIALAGDR